MTRMQTIMLYVIVLDILAMLKDELDSREDGRDTLEDAIKKIRELHEWYRTMKD